MPTHAQSTRLTLQSAVNEAQQRSLRIQGADAGVQAAEAGLRVAGRLPNPTLTVEAENVYGTGPYQSFDSSETTAAIELPLELGGKRAARKRIAEAQLTSEQIAATATRADVTMATTLAFIDVVASQRRREAAEAQQSLAEQVQRAAELRVRAGKVSPIDAQRAQVQWVNASVEAERAKRAQSLAEANLARLTGQTAPFEIAAPWFDSTTQATSAPTIEGSLELAASEARMAAATARLTAAQRERIPTVTVAAGARRLEATHDSAAVLSLSVPLPIFNSGNAEVARTRAELKRTQAEHAADQLEIEQEIEVALADLTNAKASAEAISGPALAAASEAARAVRIGYAEGKFSQLDLIDAERSLANTREAVIEALSAYHKARARLARLQGRADSIEKD